MKYRTIAIDAKNLLYRADYGANVLLTDDPEFGQNIEIGGVYGFLRSVLAIYDRIAAPGAAVIVCWEGSEGGSWRSQLFPGYKAQREPPAERIVRQIAILRRVLTDIGWMQAWSPDFEADDTLATLAQVLPEHRQPVAIVTGDRDLHQCVTSRVHVFDGKTTWTPDNVREKWGFHPSRIADFKALAGDSSDNIPGVKGIGEKGALELVKKCSTFDMLFAVAEAHANGATGTPELSASIVKKLIAGKSDAIMFKRICTVERAAPLVFAQRSKNEKGAEVAFKDLRFASLLQPSSMKAVRAIAGS